MLSSCCIIVHKILGYPSSVNTVVEENSFTIRWTPPQEYHSSILGYRCMAEYIMAELH